MMIQIRNLKREQWIYLALKYQGIWKKIYLNSFCENIPYFWKKIFAITIADFNYPKNLRQLEHPPFVLFYKGNLTLLNNKLKISVIGSRNAHWSSRTRVQQIIFNLKDHDVVWISGFAYGVDFWTHYFANLYNLKTIVCCAFGFNRLYPKQHQGIWNELLAKNNGLFLSEYPLNAFPKKAYFLERNRIISGLCNKLVVVEASIPSGTMNTVSHALSLNKEIYACRSFLKKKNSFCDLIITEGANELTNAVDLLV